MYLLPKIKMYTEYKLSLPFVILNLIAEGLVLHDRKFEFTILDELVLHFWSDDYRLHL